MPTAWLLGCASGADPFIEKYFSDCVYSLRDYIGFCLGLAAILFWIVAQVPQWVRNYRTKSAEALSPWFLAQWLLGDTFNLLGCLLQGQQLPTTTYTAMYFVVADVFMMMQYIYYGALQRRKEKILQLQVHRRHHHRRHHQHGSGRSQQPSPGAYHQVPSHVSSTKNHGVYQRQLLNQQQSMRQPQPHAGQAYHMASSSGRAHSKQYTQQCEPQELSQQLQAGAIYQLQQPQEQCLQSSSQLCSAEATAGELLLPESCATAARGQSLPMQGLMLGGVHIGGYKSAVAAGVLVTLGLVSLAVPANSTWRITPVEGAAAVKVSTPQRAMQAGLGLNDELMHSMSNPSSGSDSSLAAAQHSMSQGIMQTMIGPDRDILFVAGTMLGYCSSVLYLCSRLSQIHKNYTRKSSEGLSLAMFMMAVCANLCTGTGIVMRTFTVQELKEQLPWMIGSLGTISLDMVILWQSIRYGKKGSAGAGDDAAAAAVTVHHHRQQQVTLHIYQQQHPHHREQQQQHNWSGHAKEYNGAAAYYHSGAAALAPAAAINIPVTQHVAGSNAGMSFLSSSAPVTAAWGSLSHRQGQSSGAGLAAGRRDDAAEGHASDAAAPMLSARN